MLAELELRLFNVSEYHRMDEVGILDPDERIELIEGKIVKLGRDSPSHAGCVNRLVRSLSQAIAETLLLWPRSPVRLSDFSEPRPDVALVKFRNDFYAKGFPNPADILLIIEIADSSLLKDRDIKVPLYARSGISEVWLVNLTETLVEAYSDPLNGKYQKCQEFKREEVVASASIPGFSLSGDEILI